jgi:hypothetical protein
VVGAALVGVGAEATSAAIHFFVNLIAGLVAYTFREKKPSLNIRFSQVLPAVV